MEDSRNNSRHRNKTPFSGCRFLLSNTEAGAFPLTREALSSLNAHGVTSRLDDISCEMIGPPANLFSALHEVLATALNTHPEALCTMSFSRGCPGERDGMGVMPITNPPSRLVGSSLDCEVSLYPLGVTDHMARIHRAIEHCKAAGVYRHSVHFASRLTGPAERILATLEEIFTDAGEDAGHVVMVAVCRARKDQT